MPANFSVLIVEDDDDARRNVEDILSLDGHQTKSVTHCLPAIEAVEAESFDAVIIDWRLPDGDGSQLISLILKHQPTTPVVVITGMREFETAVKALRSGAYDFLLKPINADLLRSVLNRLVERKHHMAEIESAQRQLVASERLAAIGQMVAGLAHESRNAFQRSHACLAELSLDLESMPDSLKLVRKVQKALDDVHLLLEEVREYSATIILERRICSLEKLIEETWQQILDAGLKTNAATITVESAPEFPSECFVDPNRMRQVIRNLLENALFASVQPGKIRVRLLCESDPEPLVRIEVADNGKGVPEENCESIFDPFFTTKTRGTGLGLAISKRIVDAHEGRLFVEKSDLGGANFVVEFPCVKGKS